MEKIGQQLGHYQIIEYLGSGGMGKVYKARDLRLDRIVALKLLSKEAINLEAPRKRFFREARSAALLSHPNIATVYDIDERTDLFSFGVVLYQMLTRKLPFDGPSKIDVLVAIINSEPRPLSSYRKDLPAELPEIVSRCLAKNPAARFPSARALRVKLQ